MTTLIVGRFQQLSSADFAVRDLGRVGFRKPEMCLVYVNPHGQHAIHPVGGDADESPGTHEAGAGAMTGAAGGLGAGTLVGVATLPALGPVGPLLGAAVGAYAGALVGALKSMDENETQEPGSPPPAERPPMPWYGWLINLLVFGLPIAIIVVVILLGGAQSGLLSQISTS